MSTLNVQNITGVSSLSLDTLTANNATVRDVPDQEKFPYSVTWPVEPV